MEFREVASGLRFPEGPVVMPDGSIVVVEIAGQRVTRIAADGRKETIAEPGGGPNGLALGPDGMLYLCNNGGFGWVEDEAGRLAPHETAPDYAGGSIQRIDPSSGKVETLYTGTGNVLLRGPNDLVFDAHGGFWFTDFGKMGPRAEDRTGLFYAKADGSFIEEVVFPMRGPNGIGLSPDGTRLYAAETFTGTLHAFTVTAPGKVKEQATPGFGGHFFFRPEGQRYFDSLAVEANGNICVATLGTGGITVVSPEASQVEFVATGDPITTNIAFGGEDMRTAWITLSNTGRLVACDWPRAGLRLAH